jgi:DNA-binding NarL/FixJ family response regulator
MKFVLVEDQVMFRGLLRRLLVEDCKGKVVLEAGTLADLRLNLHALRGADLILLDIRLPDGDGIDFIDELVKAHIGTPVLLFSASCEDYIVHRVSRSFVQGFVHKDEDPKVLLTAIQMVVAGGAFFSPRFVDRQRQLAGDQTSFEKLLSPREQDFLKLIGAGYSDAEAASTLGLSAETARTHRRNIMAKLNLHSAQELQAYALKAGFTTVNRLNPA